MGTKRLLREVVIEDREAGEVTSVEKTFSIKTDTQDEFFMTYIKNMSSFFKLKSIVDIKMITKFCILAEYNTGKVILAPATRLEISEELEISSSQISKSINSLKGLKLITGDKGAYVINPMLFWKGQNKTRNQLLKDKGLEITIKFAE